MTTLAGIEIPSTSPIFLAGVAFHVAVGLCAVIAGIVAMLSRKAPGRHPTFGTIYYWSLVAVAVSATALAVVRWADELSFVCSWGSRFHSGYFWAHCSSAALGPLGTVSHRRHGSLLHSTAHSIYRQWKELAALERPSVNHLLAAAISRRAAAHPPRSSLASGGATSTMPGAEVAINRWTVGKPGF